MQKTGKPTCLSPQSVMAINLHSVLIIQCQQVPHNLPKEKHRLMARRFCTEDQMKKKINRASHKKRQVYY